MEFTQLFESVPVTGTKKRIQEYNDQCCPHCEYVYPEKGFPRILNLEEFRDLHAPAVYRCYKCEGFFMDKLYEDPSGRTDWLAEAGKAIYDAQQKWLAAHQPIDVWFNNFCESQKTLRG